MWCAIISCLHAFQNYNTLAMILQNRILQYLYKGICKQALYEITIYTIETAIRILHDPCKAS